MKAPAGLELLVVWLRRHGLKQRDAADGVGTHKNYLSSVMTGERPLSLALAKKLEAWMRSVDPKDFIPASVLLRLTAPAASGSDDKENAVSS